MSVAPDKIGHFKAGLGFAAVPAFILAFIIAPAWAALAGLGLATLAGAVKEALDLAGYGTPDFWDFAATFAGGAVGSAATYGGLALWL